MALVHRFDRHDFDLEFKWTSNGRYAQDGFRKTASRRMILDRKTAPAAPHSPASRPPGFHLCAPWSPWVSKGSQSDQHTGKYRSARRLAGTYLRQLEPWPAWLPPAGFNQCRGDQNGRL